MPRALLFVIVPGLFAALARADEKVATPETLIRLEVSPAAAPEPALRYMLLPELREMSPGNPILNFYKCCMEQQSFLYDEAAHRRREELLAMPLTELPVRELEEYGRSALSQADRAARLDNPDWQIQLQLKEDGFTLLLPDVQQMRGLSRALQVRLRGEVAQGRFDDAVRTLKTMFALSRHLGQHPTFIGNLVGIAIASTAIPSLEEMLGQPGCPNLYWALTNLPTPFIPLDRGMDGERTSMDGELRDVKDGAPMSADQIKKFIARMEMLIGEEDAIKKAKGVQGWLDAQVKDKAAVASARSRLIAIGVPEERLRRFPVEQVILLDEKRELEIRRDDLMKNLILPLWQAEAMANRGPTKRKPALLSEALVPAVKAVRRAQARLDQRIALLRTVEALRLHAAEHHGKLPAKLSEIAVPVPDDPITGKPFRYELIAATAHLRGSPPRGEEKVAILNIHYVLTVRK